MSQAKAQNVRIKLYEKACGARVLTERNECGTKTCIAERQTTWS